MPWARLVERLRPLYPKGERGRPPIGLERMLRIHFLQQWYGLADEAMEDALYDSQALARLCRHRSDGGGGSGRDDDPELPPLAGAARVEPRRCSTKSAAMLEERGLLMRQSLPRQGRGHDR